MNRARNQEKGVAVVTSRGWGVAFNTSMNFEAFQAQKLTKTSAPHNMLRRVPRPSCAA
ncbi:hypothetical protein HAX54_023318, partial [Datura stramonium]|nr:hypothetical protein [Datura stramonium]